MTGPRFTPRRRTTGRAGSVLVADFQPFTAARHLAEPLGERTPGLAVYRLDPTSDLAGGTGFTPLDRMADEYADAFLSSDHRGHTTVVGYCSAAALALRVAARLSTDRPVTTMLVLPVWPDTALVAAVLAEIRGGLGVTGQPPPDLVGDPAACLDGLVAVLSGDLRRMAAAHGIDASSGVVAELLDRYRGWLGFLLAVRDALAVPWTRDLAPHLFAAEPGAAVVPWFEPTSYRVTALGAAGPPTADVLADVLLDHLPVDR